MTDHHTALIEELNRLTAEIRALIEIQKSMAADTAAMRKSLDGREQAMPLFVRIMD